MKTLMQLILTVSQGHAESERGFPINNELPVGYLQEESFISQRFVYNIMLLRKLVTKNRSISQEKQWDNNDQQTGPDL